MSARDYMLLVVKKIYTWLAILSLFAFYLPQSGATNQTASIDKGNKAHFCSELMGQLLSLAKAIETSQSFTSISFRLSTEGPIQLEKYEALNRDGDKYTSYKGVERH